uniref:DAGKc domain-containing protein n=1 Tax=Callithrix jacchus TaxID=9483 RepID=A0A8I3X177_CALJA
MTVFFKTLQNHWKKTVPGLCLLTWRDHWLYGKHCENLLRRAAGQEAQVFGNQHILPNAQVKKATVFFNPAACKGKARTLFEKKKNAALILYLSGMDVTIVKIDCDGQAKKLLELMENTDVIIAAGGDGTLQEVVTGVLGCIDEAAFSKIPVGFIPLGETSSLSHTLFAKSGNKVQHITDATLAIVKGQFHLMSCRSRQIFVFWASKNQSSPLFQQSYGVASDSLSLYLIHGIYREISP